MHGITKTLAPNTLQQGHSRRFDVLVIGSGIAGLSYILELAMITTDIHIALVTKKRLSDSNSQYAKGGIAAAIKKQDIEAHIADTINASDGLATKKTVENILQYGGRTIEQLKKYGVNFNKQLGLEGGHSQRRIYHVNDYTGKAIITALITAVRQLSTVTIFEHHSAVNLITQLQPYQTTAKAVLGAYILNQKTAKIDTFLAKTVILATGGAGKIYQYTSNPDTATGDGIAMAHRAGASVGNMEFYQFHPTLLYHAHCNNFLISETLRGEGAHLLRAGNCKRFMANYAPLAQEMATRDIVARAIFHEIDNSDYPYVYLDIRHRGASFITKRFPHTYNALKKLGLNITKDPIPVVPAAHYLCGGVLTDVNGRTNINRLYAIGEVACSGLHGANRLASNSLLEGAVIAYNAAKDSVTYLKQKAIIAKVPDWQSQGAMPTRRRSEINAHWRSLRSEMTSYAGIIRHGHGLKYLLKLIGTRSKMIKTHYWQHLITCDLIESRNLLLVAELIVLAALKRKKSCGGHYREDYPPKSAPLQRNR